MVDKLYDFSEITALRMAELMTQTRSLQEYKRIQAIYIRARYGSDAKEIAAQTGFAVQTVRNLHSAWQRHGEAILQQKPNGGRRHENMTLAEETAFLEPYLLEAKQGRILEVKKIHQAYESKMGKKLPLSTTYRLLRRHNWRKIVPRPKHPKADDTAQQDFKKVAGHSTASPATG